MQTSNNSTLRRSNYCNKASVRTNSTFHSRLKPALCYDSQHFEAEFPAGHSMSRGLDSPRCLDHPTRAAFLRVRLGVTSLSWPSLSCQREARLRVAYKTPIVAVNVGVTQIETRPRLVLLSGRAIRYIPTLMTRSFDICL